MSVLIKKDQKLITIEEKIRTGISDKEDYEKWLLNPISPTLEEMIYKKELLFMEDRKKNYYDSEDDESD